MSTNSKDKSMASPEPLSTSSAKSGNPEAIAALINRSLVNKGVTTTALTQGQTLNIYVTTTKVLDYKGLLDFIEKGLCKLQPQGLVEASIFLRDAKSAKVLESKKFPIYISNIESKKSKIVHISQRTKQIGREDLAKNADKHQLKDIGVSKILVIIALAFVGLGTASTVGGIFWIRNSQSVAIAQALEGITSSSEGESELALMMKDRESRLTAKSELESIARFPGSRYPQARDEIIDIEADLNSLNERINIQSSQQQADAQKLADDASTLLQKVPIINANLKASREKLEEAVSLVKEIPQDAEVYAEAQTELAAYQEQLKQLDEKLTIEDKAIQDYNAALNLAMEAAKLTQGSPHTADVWQKANTKWQEAVNQLKAVPSGTSVSSNAQQKLSGLSRQFSCGPGSLEC
jgi:DNA repair exonuclease SbcCD ATPase subunit